MVSYSRSYTEQNNLSVCSAKASFVLFVLINIFYVFFFSLQFEMWRSVVTENGDSITQLRYPLMEKEKSLTVTVQHVATS